MLNMKMIQLAWRRHQAQQAAWWRLMAERGREQASQRLLRTSAALSIPLLTEMAESSAAHKRENDEMIKIILAAKGSD